MLIYVFQHVWTRQSIWKEHFCLLPILYTTVYYSKKSLWVHWTRFKTLPCHSRRGTGKGQQVVTDRIVMLLLYRDDCILIVSVGGFLHPRIFGPCAERRSSQRDFFEFVRVGVCHSLWFSWWSMKSMALHCIVYVWYHVCRCLPVNIGTKGRTSLRKSNIDLTVSRSGSSQGKKKPGCCLSDRPEIQHHWFYSGVFKNACVCVCVSVCAQCLCFKGNDRLELQTYR